MDLKIYYEKIRDVASKIDEKYPVVVSRDTPDGGKDGVLIEVAQMLAAKMLVEGSARLATPEEAQAFRQQQADAKRIAEQMAAASRLQFSVLSTEELNKLKGIPQYPED